MFNNKKSLVPPFAKNCECFLDQLTRPPPNIHTHTSLNPHCHSDLLELNFVSGSSTPLRPTLTLPRLKLVYLWMRVSAADHVPSCAQPCCFKPEVLPETDMKERLHSGTLIHHRGLRGLFSRGSVTSDESPFESTGAGAARVRLGSEAFSLSPDSSGGESCFQLCSNLLYT